jgi:hypothetical protein
MNKLILNKIFEIILICSIILFAVAYRLWFISLNPQSFAWDQDEYQLYAAKMYNAPFLLASHTYRSYPYPLFMTIIYWFWGFANHKALFTGQAINDALTGLLVLLILKTIIRKNPYVPYIGFLLYAINPFTSGYVGVGLSEVLTTFFITLTFAAGIGFMFKPSIFTGLIFGITAGMAAETRNAAFAWTVIPIGLTLIWLKWKTKIGAYVAIGCGIFLTVLYPLYVNWRDYHEINITTVDSFYAKEMFNGVVLKVLPPFTYDYPTVTKQMFWEYYSEFYPSRTTADRKAMAQKYYRMAWEGIKADPIDYIRWRFFKMWYVWQKENIFFYSEPFFNQTRYLVYWGNIMLLGAALYGCIHGFFKAINKQSRWIWGSIIGTMLYGTLAFCLTHAEYRLTIPFYPLLIISAVYSLATFFKMSR